MENRHSLHLVRYAAVYTTVRALQENTLLPSPFKNTCADTHALMRTHGRARAHTHTHAHVHTHIHTRTDTHTHTHTHLSLIHI